MTRTEFMKKNELTCKNIQWSWAFVSEVTEAVVFQSYHMNGQIIYDPEWNKGRSIASHNEINEYIDKVFNEGYEAYVVNIGGEKKDGTFVLNGYGSDIVPIEIMWNRDKLVFKFKGL